MKLNTYRFKKKRWAVFFIRRNNELLDEQTPNIIKEAPEIKFTDALDTYFFESTRESEKGNWLLGLTYLEVFNSVSSVTEEYTTSSFSTSDPVT